VASPKTDAIIDIGLDHLGRFAFFTRDNPFLSSRATLELQPRDRQMLTDLLDGSLPIGDWRRSPRGRRLVESIGIGALPRDVQVVDDEDLSGVGVLSMHGFLRAPLFWWLVSILWCISPGSQLDEKLHDGILGYRLHRRFRTEPSTSGLMFQDPGASYKRWQRFPSKAAQLVPSGAMLAATTLDLQDFYYRIQATPSLIVRSLRARADPFRLSRRALTLTRLLDILHERYAECDRVVRPRPKVQLANAVPLPVGPPSSRILANVVMTVAISELERQPRLVGVAAFADDLMVVSRVLPALEENNADYLGRLGVIVSSTEPQLAVDGTEMLGSLVVGLDKTGTSYSRAVPSDQDEDEVSEEPPADGEEESEDEDARQASKPPPPAWGAGDSYLEGAASPDWGGRLRTILRAPHKRARVPQRLRNDLTALVDVIRIGVDPDDAKEQATKLIDGLDLGLFLALRPYWTELLVAAIAANGPDAIKELSTIFVRVAESLRLPTSASGAARQALMRGLRAAWLQAAALAVAAAYDEAHRSALAAHNPPLIDSDEMPLLDGKTVVLHARRLRRRRLIPGHLVSAPLAEFTDWPDRLIGQGAFGAFEAWASAQRSDAAGLRVAIDRAVRFVPLHEACLAIHLWAAPGTDDWLDRAFHLVAAQPLVEPEQVESLRSRARSVLETQSPIDAAEERIKAHPVRFAMPSLRVPENQLAALLADDQSALGQIAGVLRSATKTIVNAAARRHAHVLVLPEWSLLPEQLTWVMSRAADARMLLIGGQTPFVAGRGYSNRLWTGIPITDSGAHRACLVPPPREKRYLSPHELVELNAMGVSVATMSPTTIPAYRWRGATFASLICFEFADISTRERLRALADVVTVSSLNMDWRYFDAVQESMTRDSYCLTVCVNTGDYPGTRIMRPTKSEKSSIAAVHGSDDPIVVTRVVDVAPVLAARRRGQRPDGSFVDEPTDGARLHDYKAYPPIGVGR
jgi:hypothetical protein